MNDATAQIPLKKIGRILLIPVFLFLTFSALQSSRDLASTMSGYTIFNRSLTENWPRTFAKLDRGLILWNKTPYNKGDAFYILPSYTYNVGTQQCSGNRFEFGPRKTDYTEVAVGDARLNDMIKHYCTKKPLKTDLDSKTIYTYSCFPVQVFYDPQHTCIAYIAKPNNPDAVRMTLKKSLALFGLVIVLKLAVALLCVWGALPLLETPPKGSQ